MGKKKGLSITERCAIISLWKEKYSYRKISLKVKRSLGAVQTAIQNFKGSGYFKDRKRCGRPKTTTPTSDRQIVRIARSNLRLTAPAKRQIL